MEKLNITEIEIPNYDTLGSFVVILTTFWGIVLARLATQLLNMRVKPNLCYLVEFTLIVLPTVLFVTIASDYSGHFVALMSLLAFWFIQKTRSLQRAKERSVFLLGQRPQFLTVMRSMIQLITSVCILAVDFNCFYRPYSKSEFFGAQLMDTGIGLFVASMAFVSRRPKTKAEMQSEVFGAALPLICFGSIRTLIVIVLKYHLAEREYGRHLNAFFILGFTKLFGSLCGYQLSSDAQLLPMGVTLLFAHQYALLYGISDYVQTDKKPPLTLFQLNRQGPLSVPGFVALYLITIHVSKWWRLKALLSYEEMVIKLRKAYRLSLLGWSLTFICSHTMGICRVTCNLGYVCWMFAIYMSMFTLCLFVFEFVINTVYPVKKFEKETLKETTVCCKRDKEIVYTYTICESVNQHGLMFFLLANAWTGLANLYLNLSLVSTSNSVAILVLYMFLNTFVVHRKYCQ
ncbi:uncharacterized protein LOC127565564 [Drosophila albomicans]|uniref:Phosphatidylinositol-glycan biosynthesis class W protein n=1 Tax=Drosophila albomicans TaxID=7291 RepID=A0A9C6T6D5_DROAB|nr:uncharacterized protein LOC127565564 [Drosophila albomicans]